MTSTPGGGSTPGRFHRPNLQEDLAACGVRPLYVPCRIAPEERNNGHMFLQTYIQIFLVWQDKNEIHPKGLVRSRSHTPYLFAKMHRWTKLRLH
jgi:hypothetical protein